MSSALFSLDKPQAQANVSLCSNCTWVDTVVINMEGEFFTWRSVVPNELSSRSAVVDVARDAVFRAAVGLAYAPPATRFGCLSSSLRAIIGKVLCKNAACAGEGVKFARKWDESSIPKARSTVSWGLEAKYSAISCLTCNGMGRPLASTTPKSGISGSSPLMMRCTCTSVGELMRATKFCTTGIRSRLDLTPPKRPAITNSMNLMKWQ